MEAPARGGLCSFANVLHSPTSRALGPAVVSTQGAAREKILENCSENQMPRRLHWAPGRNI